MNRLEGPLDGLLHLMDRQVIDDEGFLVCKVDDLELTETEDGGHVVTALLVGAPAWVPRLGSWVHERWRRLGGAQADRQRPYRIDLAEIEQLTQEIRLRRGREGVLQRQDATEASVRRLVGDLLGARVIGPGEEHLGDVLDVRLEPTAGSKPGLLLTKLLVGRGRPGSYLGYDRSDDQGPWLLNRIVRRLHRNSGLVDAGAIESIDWEGSQVRVRTVLSPVTHSGTPSEPERQA